MMPEKALEKAEKENKDLYIQACLERRRTFENTNVESRSLSVVKYVINNIMRTALTGRRKTDTYLHLVHELLYNIEWPSGRLLTYWHFVHV